MESKIAHLGFIQDIINRMATNSFLIKGWCITLVAAMFALSSKDSNINFEYLALFPTIAFYILDAYFFYQEKLFRKLYEKVADDSINSQQFTLDTNLIKNEDYNPIFEAIFLPQTLLFYFLIISAVLYIV